MAHLGLGEAALARSQLERSLALYDPVRDEAATHMFGQNTQVHSRGLLSLTLLCLGEIEESLSVGISALDGADAIRHPHSTAIALGYFGGWVLAWLGVPGEMMAMARRLIALAEQHRLAAFHAYGTAFFGWALCQNDDLVQGISALEQAIKEMDAIDSLQTRAGYLTALANAQRRAGALELALQTSLRARAFIDDGTDVWLAPEVLRVQSLVTRDAGGVDAAGAESLARSAAAKARELKFPFFELRCLDTLAEIAGRDAALEQRAETLSRYRNVGRLAVRALRRRHAPVG
jgi:predicted ATPase